MKRLLRTEITLGLRERRQHSPLDNGTKTYSMDTKSFDRRLIDRPPQNRLSDLRVPGYVLRQLPKITLAGTMQYGGTGNAIAGSGDTASECKDAKERTVARLAATKPSKIPDIRGSCAYRTRSRTDLV
jgi:hypothetical protein